MDEKIIGIDFGDTSVSVVVMSVIKGIRRVEAAVQIPMSGQSVRECLIEAMAAVRTQKDVSGAGCIVSMPDGCVSYRIIHLPFIDRKKIDKVLGFELEPLLPFPMADVVVDYYISSTASTGNDRATLFSAAVLKTALKEHLDGLAAAGLEPDMVVPRGYATAAVLAGEMPFGLAAEKDGDAVFLSFIADSRVQFSRMIRLSREPDRFVPDLCARIRHSILAYEELCRRDFKAQPIFLTGPGWPDEAVSRIVENNPGSQVKKVEVAAMAGLSKNGWTEDSGREQAGGQAQAALSLALLRQSRRSGLNFRRAEFAISGKWRQYSGALLKTAALGLLAMALGLSADFYQQRQMKKQIASLDARISEVFREFCPHVPVIVDPLPQLRAELQRLNAGGGLSADMTRKTPVIDILNDISRLIPSGTDVVVTRLLVGMDEVMVTGNTDAFNAVDTIKNRLGESGFFGKVDISSATMNRVDQRVHFNMRVTLL